MANQQSNDPLNGTGYTPEEASQKQRERGDSQQSATGGANAGRYTGFNSAPPESNVGPAGKAQSDHGFAGKPVPDEERSGDPVDGKIDRSI